MKFVLFSMQSCSLEEFISFWMALYNEEKYPDSDYEVNLARRRLLEESNILPLLEWKNGKKLPEDKKHIPALIRQHLQRFNQFRLLKDLTEEDFKEFWKCISKIVKSGLVWRVFLLHMARPVDYPMVDQHVLRAYHFLTHGEVSEPEQSLETYFIYKNFIYELVRQSSKDLRNVDKALMAFGQFLKSQFYHFGEKT